MGFISVSPTSAEKSPMSQKFQYFQGKLRIDTKISPHGKGQKKSGFKSFFYCLFAHLDTTETERRAKETKNTSYLLKDNFRHHFLRHQGSKFEDWNLRDIWSFFHSYHSWRYVQIFSHHFSLFQEGFLLVCIGNNLSIFITNF